MVPSESVLHILANQIKHIISFSVKYIKQLINYYYCIAKLSTVGIYISFPTNLLK